MVELYPTRHEEYELIHSRLANFSGFGYEERVKDLVRGPIVDGKATKMVVFPDLGETEKHVVPTGSVTEFDTRITPGYLSWVKGADIGCGMLAAEFDVSAEDLTKDRERLQADVDEITREIMYHPKATTGSGNHFLDWTMNVESKKLVGVIHTGSPRDQQNEVGEMVKAMEIKGDWDYTAYKRAYGETFEAADVNRKQLLEVLENKYGRSRTIFHKPHNVILWDDKNYKVTIYKGAVYIDKTDEYSLLPSHMQGDMYLYKPGPNFGEKTMFGLPHGTGRRLPMRQMKENFNVEPLRIVVPSPDLVTVSRKQYPEAYRPIGEVEKIMQADGLMEPVDFDSVLIPIAYTGHLKNKS